MTPRATRIMRPLAKEGIRVTGTLTRPPPRMRTMNRTPVTNTEEFASAIRHSSGESLLLINRDGNKVFLAV